MLKSKFGAAVRSKTATAQVNEVLAKCLLHNLTCLVQAIFSAGLAPRFWQDAAPAVASRPTLTFGALMSDSDKKNKTTSALPSASCNVVSGNGRPLPMRSGPSRRPWRRSSSPVSPFSASVALRTARALGVMMDDLLVGKFLPQVPAPTAGTSSRRTSRTRTRWQRMRPLAD